MTYSDKFQFAHAGTTQLYTLIRQKNLSRPLWACTQDSDNGYHGALYTEQEISDHFAMGHWAEISDKEAVQPEMKFPFTYTHLNSCNIYTVVKNPMGTLQWYANGCYNEFDDDLFTESELREHIKSGDMIVLSVGEQPQEPALKVGNLESISTNSLTLSMDSDDLRIAAIRAEHLAQKCEELAIALESVKALMQELGMTAIDVSGDCHAFCCGDD